MAPIQDMISWLADLSSRLIAPDQQLKFILPLGLVLIIMGCRILFVKRGIAILDRIVNNNGLLFQVLFMVGSLVGTYLIVTTFTTESLQFEGISTATADWQPSGGPMAGTGNAIKIVDSFWMQQPWVTNLWFLSLAFLTWYRLWLHEWRALKGVETILAARSTAGYNHAVLYKNPIVRLLHFSLKRAYFGNEKVRVELKALEDDLRKDEFGTREQIDYALDMLKAVRFSNILTSVYHGIGTTLTLAIGLPSLILTLVTGVMPYFYVGEGWLNIAYFLVYSVCAVLWFHWLVLQPFLCWFLRKQVYTMPASDYASVVADALESSQLILFTNFKIHRLCREFEKFTKDELVLSLHSEQIWDPGKKTTDDTGIFNTSIDERRSVQEKVQSSLSDLITKSNIRYRTSKVPEIRTSEQIIALIRNELIELEFIKAHDRENESARIELLIRIFAKRHGIEYVEACEHIFQFSPALFRAWSIKYRQNALTLLEMCRRLDAKRVEGAVYFERMRQVSEQNRRLVERIERIRKYQAQSIAFSELHNHVIEMASTRSSGGCGKDLHAGVRRHSSLLALRG
jgi:hypothetical protein